jgi:hypothetical protein
MERHSLVEQLTRLHEQLSRTKTADPATLEELRKLTDDIDRLVGEQTVDREDAEPITSGLRNLLLQFEADHPQLSVAIGKVADALAAIGI